jgi:hypothetical protein
MITVAPSAAITGRPRRRLVLRHLWIVAGLALAIGANLVANEHGLGIVPLLAFGILPHLPALAFRRRGQLGTRAATLFNGLHEPIVPLVVSGIAATGLLGPLWLVSALTWLGHILVDRGLGDGRRNADGSRLRPTPR